MSYTYIQSEPALWTVGQYRPDGKWEPESDHGSSDEAAARAAWLNGSGLVSRTDIAPDPLADVRATIDTASRVLDDMPLPGRTDSYAEVAAYAAARFAQAQAEALLTIARKLDDLVDTLSPRA